WATLAPLLWTLAALGLKALCQQPLTRRRVLSLAAALLLQLLLWLHAGFAPWSRTLVLSMAGAGALAGLVAVLARSARWQLPAAVGLLLYAASGPAWYHAYDFAPMFTVDDESFVKQGLFLKQVLPPDTRVATAWIGAPAYFSDLYFIDIEGKVDPHVAHIQGSEPFRAGFTKRDPAWSVGRLKPDVLLYRSPQWGCYGYTPLSNDLCVRPDRLPALAALAGNWCDEHDRSRYCP
ncbi:MAG TPA: hypothetical protein VHE37_04865, partial [Nevskiaceae bacterium]|nr:hypothetical protein [Nevskiaceae bacterium]